MDRTSDKFKTAFRTALEEETKPKAKKPVQPLTQNPGQGYHGIAYKKHNDTDKAHAEYKKMHAKVKDLAGEAGHLTNSKKPNVMVRDYLDSKRGRHLEGLEADDQYIKKDFGGFAKSYDPKLFEETLNEGDLKFTEHHTSDDRGSSTKIHVHHKGEHVATIHRSHYNSQPEGEHVSYHILKPDDKQHPAFIENLPNKYKKKTLFGKVKPGQEHDKISTYYPTKRSALRVIKQHYSGKLNESSAAAIFERVLDEKRKPAHPDSLVGLELDDESLATKK